MPAAEQAETAGHFLGAWADLLVSLPDDYGCWMTCAVADTAADLLRVFGYFGSADELIRCHAEHDEPGDSHYAEVTT
jgi:hypothetical protein